METPSISTSKPRPSVSFSPVEQLKQSKAQKTNLIRSNTLNAVVKMRREKRLRRHESVIALEELVKCGICLSMLQNPKMLPCQHTFCHDCLKQVLQQANSAIECPVCKQKSVVKSVDDLPSNLYINNLISVLMTETEEVSNEQKVETAKELIVNGILVPDKICAKCKTVCQDHIVKCQHCKMDFCGVCFPEHAEDLTSRYADFIKQLDEHKITLNLEQNNYKRHCGLLEDEIKQSFVKKIEELKNKEETMLLEVSKLHESGNMEILHISSKVENLKLSIENQTETKAHNKVINYMDFHQQMSHILDTISLLSENYKQFNGATLKLVTPSSSPNDEPGNFIYDEIKSSQINPELLLTYYKNKVFRPKMVYHKFQKPTGLCTSPWDSNQVYVCNLKTIYAFDITAGKVSARILDDKMAWPQSIACSFATQEIFVSDKIKNVIHVFNKDGGYVRNLAPKELSNPHGIAITQNGDLLVCDTGNDRIIIIDTLSGKVQNTVGIVRGKTEFSMPMDVTTDGKIIVVADVGNHRIKIFDAETLMRINEIGSLGRQKGQFRSAEVVHIDESGYILVGDSGNKRIQIFTSEGDFVQSTGSDYKFDYISGICTSNKVDIFVTDYKSKSLVRF